MLVDGDIRDAVSLSDWVLQPNTEYYRFDGMTLIGETNSDSIFDIHFSDLVNSIDEDFTGIAYAWTGISDTSDFSSDTNTCDGWSSAEQGLFSRIGYWHLTDSSVFSASTTSTCSFHWHFYCVEQP